MNFINCCFLICAWCVGVHTATKPDFLIGKLLLSSYYNRLNKLNVAKGLLKGFLATNLVSPTDALKEKINALKEEIVSLERSYDNVLSFIFKPLFGCLICMSSFHSILLCVFWFEIYDFCIIIFIFAVAGLNTIVDKFLNS